MADNWPQLAVLALLLTGTVVWALVLFLSLVLAWRQLRAALRRPRTGWLAADCPVVRRHCESCGRRDVPHEDHGDGTVTCLHCGHSPFLPQP